MQFLNNIVAKSRFANKKIISLFFLAVLLIPYLLKPSYIKMISSKELKPIKENKASKEVFGFAPYWTLDGLDNVDFNTLTTLAYFDIPILRSGDIDISSGGYNVFKSDKTTQIFKKAHSVGTRVVATITQMDPGVVTDFLDDPNAQKNAISQVVDLVDKRGIDGVNIDFEYITDPGQAYRDKFSNFVKNLSDAMHAKVAGSKVTVSVIASAQKDPKLYDIGKISANSDGIFMMAYDYAVSNSSVAMPTSPLYGYKEGKYWYDVSTAVEDFLKVMPANKLILGLPWYGYDYAVYSPTANSQTYNSYYYSSSFVQTYSTAGNIVATDYFEGWDDYGKVGYRAYYSPYYGTWRMVYIEDPKSLAIKYDFAKKKNLAGVGIWALGFDQGRKDLWAVLKDKFGQKIADARVLGREIINGMD